MRNFRGAEKFSRGRVGKFSGGGGLRNFRGRGVEKFQGGGVILFQEGLHFFGRGDIFREGL